MYPKKDSKILVSQSRRMGQLEKNSKYVNLFQLRLVVMQGKGRRDRVIDPWLISNCSFRLQTCLQASRNLIPKATVQTFAGEQ